MDQPMIPGMRMSKVQRHPRRILGIAAEEPAVWTAPVVKRPRKASTCFAVGFRPCRRAGLNRALQAALVAPADQPGRMPAGGGTSPGRACRTGREYGSAQG